MSKKTTRRFTFKPKHSEEDHDHIMFDGKEIVRIDYGEVDHRGRGIGGAGPYEIRKLVRAANAALSSAERGPFCTCHEVGDRHEHGCAVLRANGDS